MNLVSIDLERGQLRFYISVAGSKPKPVYRVDIPEYSRDMGWDLDQIEAFRLDPMSFVARAKQEAGIGPEAA
jgi:hypothetical protein